MAKSKYTANWRIAMDGETYAPGDTLELDDEQAKQAGMAVSPIGASSGGNSADGGTAELDAALFTPAALKKAQELGMTAETFARRKKTAADGAKFGVEDVERIHASVGGSDE